MWYEALLLVATYCLYVLLCIQFDALLRAIGVRAAAARDAGDYVALEAHPHVISAAMRARAARGPGGGAPGPSSGARRGCPLHPRRRLQGGRAAGGGAGPRAPRVPRRPVVEAQADAHSSGRLVAVVPPPDDGRLWGAVHRLSAASKLLLPRPPHTAAVAEWLQVVEGCRARLARAAVAAAPLAVAPLAAAAGARGGSAHHDGMLLKRSPFYTSARRGAMMVRRHRPRPRHRPPP